MQLHGLSKLTLLDYPEHLACTAFTGSCNFRCPFCHNAPLVLTPASCETIDEESFFQFLSSRVGKLEGVCITGGEPTLQKGLPDFLRRIRALGFLVKLDTNGYEPSVLHSLIDNRLIDMVAMDIKNSPTRYAQTVGLPKGHFNLSLIEESISLLLSAGIPHEFRTTVTKELHDEASMQELGQWLCGLSVKNNRETLCSSPYYLQNFKASEQLVCQDTSRFHPFSAEELQALLSVLTPFLPNTRLRGE